MNHTYTGWKKLDLTITPVQERRRDGISVAQNMALWHGSGDGFYGKEGTRPFQPQANQTTAEVSALGHESHFWRKI